MHAAIPNDDVVIRVHHTVSKQYMAFGGRRYEVGIDRCRPRFIPANFNCPVLFDEVFVNARQMKEQIVAVYNWCTETR